MNKMLRIFLRAVLCGVIPFSLLLSGISVSAYTGNARQTLTAGTDIRVMSYNVLVDTDLDNGGWSWGTPLGNRAEKASAAIAYYKPDVIGFQECTYNWHVVLKKNLPDYAFVNGDVPEEQRLEASSSLGKKDWMCTTMMYNTKTLELIDNELIGYSVNYWGNIQRMRYISMALFKVKKTGETFVFTSTHLDAEKDSKGDTMRRTQATELANRILYYKETYDCPIISTGDYNKSYNDEPVALIRQQAGMTAHSSNRGGIDYILYSEGVECRYFTAVKDAALSGASDHDPIFGDFALEDNFSYPTTTTTTKRPTTTTTTTQRPTALRPTGVGSRPTTTTPATPDGGDAGITQVPVDTTVPTQTTDLTTTQPSLSDGSATVPAEPPSSDGSVTTTVPSASSVPTQALAEDDEDREDNGKDNGYLAYLVVGCVVAAVGVLAAVAAVLLRKKK